MIKSKRCTVTMVLVLSVFLAAEIQAFTCIPASRYNKHGRGGSAAAATAAAAIRFSEQRTAFCGPLAMSEMEEDYPSDTGDDRFSAEGWFRWRGCMDGICQSCIVLPVRHRCCIVRVVVQRAFFVADRLSAEFTCCIDVLWVAKGCICNTNMYVVLTLALDQLLFGGLARMHCARNGTRTKMGPGL